MDALEVITANTSVEDELAFFLFALRDRRVHVISQQASLDGPIYLSIDDLARLRASNSPDDHTVLLWNAKLAAPFCWSLYLAGYDLHWKPRSLDDPSSHKQPKTTAEFLVLHASLRTGPITKDLFAHGHYERTLSPIIEVSLPSAASGDCLVTAEFSNWVNQEVWIVWDAYRSRWIYETRDLNRLANERFEKGADFTQWQRTLFDWVRANWAGKIDPQETYRF